MNNLKDLADAADGFQFHLTWPYSNVVLAAEDPQSVESLITQFESRRPPLISTSNFELAYQGDFDLRPLNSLGRAHRDIYQVYLGLQSVLSFYITSPQRCSDVSRKSPDLGPCWQEFSPKRPGKLCTLERNPDVWRGQRGEERSKLQFFFRTVEVVPTVQYFWNGNGSTINQYTRYTVKPSIRVVKIDGAVFFDLLST